MTVLRWIRLEVLTLRLQCGGTNSRSYQDLAATSLTHALTQSPKKKNMRQSIQKGLIAGTVESQDTCMCRNCPQRCAGQAVNSDRSVKYTLVQSHECLL